VIRKWLNRGLRRFGGRRPPVTPPKGGRGKGGYIAPTLPGHSKRVPTGQGLQPVDRSRGEDRGNEQELDIQAAYKRAAMYEPSRDRILAVLTSEVERIVHNTLDEWKAAEAFVGPDFTTQQRQLHFDREAYARAEQLVAECLANRVRAPTDFKEWFRMAYALGKVTHCIAKK